MVFYHSVNPNLTLSVRKDMISLFQQGRWALIPSPEALSRIKELFFLNHENTPRHRLMFTDVGYAVGYITL